MKIQKEEVEQVAWVSVDQLRDELKTCPDKYIEAMPGILDNFAHKDIIILK